jgi:hypothetical protein
MIKKLALGAMWLAASGLVQAETAQEAWTGLVGKKAAARGAFVFVEIEKGLPNVLIYGDSISIGYTPAVRQALAGTANVVRIHCNGGAGTSIWTWFISTSASTT